MIKELDETGDLFELIGGDDFDKVVDRNKVIDLCNMFYDYYLMKDHKTNEYLLRTIIRDILEEVSFSEKDYDPSIVKAYNVFQTLLNEMYGDEIILYDDLPDFNPQMLLEKFNYTNRRRKSCVEKFMKEIEIEILKEKDVFYITHILVERSKEYFEEYLYNSISQITYCEMSGKQKIKIINKILQTNIGKALRCRDFNDTRDELYLFGGFPFIFKTELHESLWDNRGLNNILETFKYKFNSPTLRISNLFEAFVLNYYFRELRRVKTKIILENPSDFKSITMKRHK